MAGTDKRKQSLYFAEDMLNEIMAEAIRLDRSLSWIVQRAWLIAVDGVRKFPSVDHRAALTEVGPGVPRPRPAQSPEPEPPSEPERQPGPQVREFISGMFDKK